jgi:ketosteroid isomerase-like protein
MSQQNVRVVRAAVDAWNRRDPGLWCSYATPDIEWVPAGPAALEGTVHRGYDEVVAGLESVWEAWDEVFFEESEIIDRAQATLWLGRLKLRGATSHVALDQEFAVRFVLRAGKLAKIHAFLSLAEALETIEEP